MFKGGIYLGVYLIKWIYENKPEYKEQLEKIIKKPEEAYNIGKKDYEFLKENIESFSYEKINEFRDECRKLNKKSALARKRLYDKTYLSKYYKENETYRDKRRQYYLNVIKTKNNIQ